MYNLFGVVLAYQSVHRRSFSLSLVVVIVMVMKNYYLSVWSVIIKLFRATATSHISLSLTLTQHVISKPQPAPRLHNFNFQIVCPPVHQYVS